MRWVTLLLVVSFSLGVVSGCGNSLSQSGLNRLSELHGVYDGGHALRLAQEDESGRFYFQACLLEPKQSIREVSCVSALKSSTGEPVTFEWEDLSKVPFNLEEFYRLEELVQGWGPYRRAMTKRKAGVAVNLGIGGFGGSTAWVTWSNERKGVLRDLGDYRSELAELEQAPQSSIKTASSLKTPPKKSTLFSGDFIEHVFNYTEVGESLGNSSYVVDLLKNVEAPYGSVDYDALIKGFISRGYQVTDMIHPDTTQLFMKHLSSLKSSHELSQMMAQNPVDLLRELVAYGQTSASKVVEGVDDSVNSLVKERAARAAHVRSLIGSFEQELRQVNRKIMLGVIAVVSAIVTVDLLSKKDTTGAVEVVAGSKNQHKDFKEVFGFSSPLWLSETDSKVFLHHVSVKKILGILAARVYSKRASNSDLSIGWQCMPQALSYGGVREECWEFDPSENINNKLVEMLYFTAPLF